MRRPYQIAAGLLAASVLTLAPTRAGAQDVPEALAGEKPQENGFKIGPGRLHVFLTEGLVYNSQAVAVPVSPAARPSNWAARSSSTPGPASTSRSTGTTTPSG